jgi:hypothetical protein
MEVSLSNFTIRFVCELVGVVRVYLNIIRNDGKSYSFIDYINRIWRDTICTWGISRDACVWPSLTEKTAVRIAVAVRQRPISEQQIFHESARNYSITKLILLREIATQYLTSDIFITLFDMTE